jgi:hypothetical protein
MLASPRGCEDALFTDYSDTAMRKPARFLFGLLMTAALTPVQAQLRQQPDLNLDAGNDHVCAQAAIAAVPELDQLPH